MSKQFLNGTSAHIRLFALPRYGTFTLKGDIICDNECKKSGKE